MLENLPDYIAWVFALTTFAAVAFFLYAIYLARPPNGFFIALSATLGFFLIVQARLAMDGFYLVTNALPPRFALAAPPTVLILLLLFVFNRKRFAAPSFPLQILTLLHVVRVPVEIVLLWLFQNKQIPQLMTFEGRNFDILAGLTAPFIAWLAFRNGKTNRTLLIVWNLIALGLLINIVATAILTLPAPFQRFAFDQPNRAVLYFPFIWLPSIVVPIVLVSHLLCLWKLFGGDE